MDKHEYLNQADSSAIEELYKNYLLDPQSVDISWRRFFEGFEFARGTQSILPAGFTDVDTEFRVLNLIDWYRKRGHLFTKTNPVRERRKYFPTLDIENYGLLVLGRLPSERSFTISKKLIVRVLELSSCTFGRR
jgi:2-oxoglutarate dehydrogenase E1 component